MDRCKYLKDEEIERKAHSFINKHHAGLEMPVPIDLIIEKFFDINIVPFPRLYKDYRISSFLSLDRKSIWIDETQYDMYEQKYRFSLAHELGHLFLHAEIFEEASDVVAKSSSVIEDYIEWLTSYGYKIVKRMDYQADKFAAHILMPTASLQVESTKILSNIASDSDLTGISKEEMAILLVEELADLYNVYKFSVAIRLENDFQFNGLCNIIKLP